VRHPLPGLGTELPGRREHLRVGRRGDAQQRLTQVDRSRGEAEFFVRGKAFHENGGVHRTGGKVGMASRDGSAPDFTASVASRTRARST
jgi:hypothetical protein